VITRYTKPFREQESQLKLHALFAGALGLVLAIAGVADAGTIQAGDLIVVDRGNMTLDDINPTTGALNFVIASGFSNPQGLAINSQGIIFVSDIGTSTIDQVNPTTGMITPFSGMGAGTGPTLDRPFQMAFNSSGTLYVADGGTPNGNTTAVFAIDTHGNRTLVAGNNGSSNNLFAQFLAGLALDSKGNIYAGAPTGHTIYSVASGTATSLSTAATAPQGLAFGANGQLLAINGNPSNPAIYSINPMHGNASILSDNSGAQSGPAFNVLRGITVAPNGTIYATDVGNNDIYAVDPSTGDRLLVSSSVGGATGSLTYGIAVYTAVSSAVPEPSSVVLLAVGAAGLILYRKRNRSVRTA